MKNKFSSLMKEFHKDQRGEAGKPNKPKDKKRIQYMIMAAAAIMIVVGLLTK
ncbi:hypothetical protein [Aneurinibacillus tyrosinisolvens]|uniref:hypothetical protein n=1 Tax=Aneurinibacillus tyrosinisolvens TaxID=1443435 RepID=UPI000B31CF8E|nr:hypothetical protein [Aneurinibacillus tyrosinisolvens]